MRLINLESEVLTAHGERIEFPASEEEKMRKRTTLRWQVVEILSSTDNYDNGHEKLLCGMIAEKIHACPDTEVTLTAEEGILAKKIMAIDRRVKGHLLAQFTKNIVE